METFEEYQFKIKHNSIGKNKYNVYKFSDLEIDLNKSMKELYDYSININYCNKYFWVLVNLDDTCKNCVILTGFPPGGESTTPSKNSWTVRKIAELGNNFNQLKFYIGDNFLNVTNVAIKNDVIVFYVED